MTSDATQTGTTTLTALQEVVHLALRDPEFRKQLIFHPRKAVANEPRLADKVELTDEEYDRILSSANTIRHAGDHCDETAQNWISRMFDATNCAPWC